MRNEKTRLLVIGEGVTGARTEGTRGAIQSAWPALRQFLGPHSSLMHSAAAGSLARPVLTEQEGEENQENGHIRQLHVDVLIALHAGLEV